MLEMLVVVLESKPIISQLFIAPRDPIVAVGNKPSGVGNPFATCSICNLCNTFFHQFSGDGHRFSTAVQHMQSTGILPQDQWAIGGECQRLTIVVEGLYEEILLQL